MFPSTRVPFRGHPTPICFPTKPSRKGYSLHIQMSICFHEYSITERDRKETTNTHRQRCARAGEIPVWPTPFLLEGKSRGFAAKRLTPCVQNLGPSILGTEALLRQQMSTKFLKASRPAPGSERSEVRGQVRRGTTNSIG